MDWTSLFLRWSHAVWLTCAIIGLLPLAFAHWLRNSLAGTYFITAGMMAFYASAFLYISTLAYASARPLSLFLYATAVYLALVSFWSIVRLPYSLKAPNEPDLPRWLQFVCFFSALAFIPIIFGTWGAILDPSDSTNRVFHLHTDFTLRLFDIMSFGYLSTYHGEILEKYSSAISTKRWFIMLFNLSVGAYLLSPLVAMIRQHTSHQA